MYLPTVIYLAAIPDSGAILHARARVLLRWIVRVLTHAAAFGVGAAWAMGAWRV